jgi:hypothetical protein
MKYRFCKNNHFQNLNREKLNARYVHIFNFGRVKIQLKKLEHKDISNRLNLKLKLEIQTKHKQKQKPPSQS